MWRHRLGLLKRERTRVQLGQAAIRKEDVARGVAKQVVHRPLPAA
ncbi:hypothetical protein ACQ858_22645 [Variovorax ureilyticus]